MPLIDDGVPVLLITKLLFLDEQSIHNLLQRYQLGKIDVLLDNHYHGKESMLTDEQADQLHQHVADNIYMDCILVIAYILLEFGTSYSWSGVQHQGENKYIEPFSDLLNIYGRRAGAKSLPTRSTV